MRVSAQSVSSLTKRARLEVYIAAGVGALGLGTTSDAGVVSIDLTGKTGPNAGLPGNFGSFQMFPPGSMSTLFAWNGYGGHFGIALQGIPGDGSGIAISSLGVTQPRNFAAGQTIDDNSDFQSSYPLTLFRHGSGFVSPDFGANSFLGFKTAEGRFGYIEVTWTAATNTFYLISAAYESDIGVAIQTPGGSAAIPEPTSGAIAALLMGGTALRQWRKRRRPVDDQEAAESLAS